PRPPAAILNTGHRRRIPDVSDRHAVPRAAGPGPAALDPGRVLPAGRARVLPRGEGGTRQRDDPDHVAAEPAAPDRPAAGPGPARPHTGGVPSSAAGRGEPVRLVLHRRPHVHPGPEREPARGSRSLRGGGRPAAVSTGVRPTARGASPAHRRTRASRAGTPAA